MLHHGHPPPTSLRSHRTLFWSCCLKDTLNSKALVSFRSNKTLPFVHSQAAQPLRPCDPRSPPLPSGERTLFVSPEIRFLFTILLRNSPTMSGDSHVHNSKVLLCNAGAGAAAGMSICSLCFIQCVRILDFSDFGQSSVYFNLSSSDLSLKNNMDWCRSYCCYICVSFRCHQNKVSGSWAATAR